MKLPRGEAVKKEEAPTQTASGSKIESQKEETELESIMDLIERNNKISEELELAMISARNKAPKSWFDDPDYLEKQRQFIEFWKEFTLQPEEMRIIIQEKKIKNVNLDCHVF